MNGGRGTSLPDVVGLLKKYGCSAEGVTSIAREENGKPGTFEVSFCGLTTLRRILDERGEKSVYTGCQVILRIR